MTKEQIKLRINLILKNIDILKVSVHDTLDGFGSENTEAYDEMFDALYKQVEVLRP